MKKLEKLVKKALKTNYYRKLWSRNGGDFFLNFNEIPLSNKRLFNSKNIRNSLSVSEEKVSHYYFSSGTTSVPKMIPFTSCEWEDRAEYRMKCYEILGIEKKDRVAVLLPFGPWIAGPLAQQALMKLGCVVFPIGDLIEKEELKGLFKIIEKNLINVVATAPSFLERFMDVYKKEKETFRLEKIITSGEYISPEMKKKASTLFGAKVYSSYAMSETFIGVECGFGSGFHYNPEELYIETIPEKTSSRNRNDGSIVITVYSSDAVPIIRYDTGDLGEICYEQCSCGVKWPKIHWLGRSFEAFVVAGAVNVHPSQIYSVFPKSRIIINRCDIKISSNEKGRDFLDFTFFTPVNESEWPKNIREEIKHLIENMSIDLQDVVYSKIVKVKVNLLFEKVNKRAIKKKIKINDVRKKKR